MTSESGGQKWMPIMLGAMGVMVLAIAYLFKVAVFDGKGGKIGVVKTDVVLNQYRPAIAVQQRLDTETASAQRELEGRYRELQNMDAELQRKSKVLTSQALAPQINALQEKQNEFLQLQQLHQQSLQQKQAQFLSPIVEDIRNFINKYGRDNGYTILLGVTNEGGLLYGDPAVDITDIIVAELNAKVPPSMPVPMLQDTTKK